MATVVGEGHEGSPVKFVEVAMRMLILLVLVFGILGTQPVDAGEAPSLEAFVQSSRAKVKAFAVSLKGELQSALEEGGASQAIPVCNVKAPQISRDLSEPAAWSIGRTSHKIRNPDNAPDDWEAAVLGEFQSRATAGESLKTMEKAELVESDPGRAYRYMKAIPVGEICLTCHGAEIDPALKAQIDSFYPEDQATGFILGELRGAFTVTRSLPD